MYYYVRFLQIGSHFYFNGSFKIIMMAQPGRWNYHVVMVLLYLCILPMVVIMVHRIWLPRKPRGQFDTRVIKHSIVVNVHHVANKYPGMYRNGK